MYPALSVLYRSWSNWSRPTGSSPGHGHRHPPGGLVQVLLGVPEEARAIKGDLQTVGGLPGIPPSAQIQLPLGIPPDGAEPQVHVLRLLLVLPPPGLLTQGGQLRRQMEASLSKTTWNRSPSKVRR